MTDYGSLLAKKLEIWREFWFNLKHWFGSDPYVLEIRWTNLIIEYKLCFDATFIFSFVELSRKFWGKLVIV